MKKITKFTLILLAIFLAAICFEAIMPTPKVVTKIQSTELVKKITPEEDFNKKKGIILNTAYKLISEKNDRDALFILEKYEFTKDKDILQAMIEIKTRNLILDLSKSKSDEDSKKIMLEMKKLKAKSIEINAIGYEHYGQIK